MSVPLIYCGGYRNLEIEARGREPGGYEVLMDIFRKSGFVPHVVRPAWDDEETGPEEWVEQILDEIIDNTPQNGRVVVGGFSLGGLLAYRAVNQIEAAYDPQLSFDVRLFGASVSPWARPLIDGAWSNPKSEVRTAMPEWLQCGFLNFRIKPPLTVPAQFYIGSGEHHRVQAMHECLAQTSLNSAAIRIAGAEHDILHPRYLKKIAGYVGRLAKVEAPSLTAREEYRMRFGRFALAEVAGSMIGEYVFNDLETRVQYGLDSVPGPYPMGYRIRSV
jgi:hypothetical protein